MRLKQLKIQIITLLLCGVIFLLCACSADVSEASFEAMDTFIQVKAYGKAPETAVNEVREEVLRLDSILSAAGEGSKVSALNRTGELADDEIAALTRSTLEICDSTGGALDISVYPLVEEWGFISRDYKIPGDDAIKALLQNTGYKKIEADGASVSIPEGMKLDFGAVAKGYAADRVEEILDKKEIPSAIVNLGGTVLAHGRKTDESLWKVGIANPENSSDYIGYISCADKTVATSGSYERYFVGGDGVRYCHIIDPGTGKPVQNGIASVTIISESGLKCDALSTALFVMGRENAENYWKENGGFDYVMLTEDGRAFVTSGVFESFTLAQGGKYEIEEVK